LIGVAGFKDRQNVVAQTAQFLHCGYRKIFVRENYPKVNAEDAEVGAEVAEA
jgi:hypothetical protein